MANLTQRALGWARDSAQTTLARTIQLVSQMLGRFTPNVQTRIVRIVQIGVEVHVKSAADDVSTHAAALTYAAFLSIVPLMVLGLALSSEIAESTTADSEWFTRLVDGIPGLAPLIASRQQQLARNATSLGVIGLVGVLWTASTLTSRAQHALAVVFGLPRRTVANRMRALTVTIGLGLALVLTLVATGVVIGLQTNWLLTLPLKVMSAFVLLATEVAYFTLAYWLLTPLRTTRLRDHLVGGALMAVGWGVLSYVGAFFVDRTISRSSVLYGALGTVFGLLLFIRLSMWLFLYGAEVTSIVRPRREDDDRRARHSMAAARPGSRSGSTDPSR